MLGFVQYFALMLLFAGLNWVGFLWPSVKGLCYGLIGSVLFMMVYWRAVALSLLLPILVSGFSMVLGWYDPQMVWIAFIHVALAYSSLQLWSKWGRLLGRRPFKTLLKQGLLMALGFVLLDVLCSWRLIPRLDPHDIILQFLGLSVTLIWFPWSSWRNGQDRRANHLAYHMPFRGRRLPSSVLRQLTDFAPVPLIINRLKDGQILYANYQACCLFGLPEHPHQPLFLHQFIKTSPVLLSRLYQLLQQGLMEDKELQLTTSCGKTFTGQVASNLIRIRDEKIVLSSVVNVSERLALEKQLQEANRQLQEKISQSEEKRAIWQKTALVDSLTGVYNRFHLEKTLPRLLEACRIQSQPLSLMMVDVDHFKSINDRYGHLAGDDVLLNLGKILKSLFRADDLVCRYGGEEFLIALPNMPLMLAKEKAERLRQQIAEQRIMLPCGEYLRLTVSVGVISSTQTGFQLEKLVEMADYCLYQAKRTGRNRVCSDCNVVAS